MDCDDSVSRLVNDSGSPDKDKTSAEDDEGEAGAEKAQTEDEAPGAKRGAPKKGGAKKAPAKRAKKSKAAASAEKAETEKAVGETEEVDVEGEEGAAAESEGASSATKAKAAPKRKRASKASAKKQEADSADQAAVGEDSAAAVVPVEASPETVARIEQHKGEMNALAEELVIMEELPEVQDSDFETEEAIEEMLKMVKNADSYKQEFEAEVAKVQEANDALESQAQQQAAAEKVEKSEEGEDEREKAVVSTALAAPDAPQLLELPVLQEPCDRLYGAIKNIIARTMQGSSDPLSHLCISVSARLGRAKQILDAEPSEGESELVQEYRTILSEGLENLLDDGDALEKEITTMAAREAYGPKNKGVSPFEDMEPTSVWRWEVIASVHFSKAGLALNSEAKRYRNRYGRALKSIQKLCEQLAKLPYDSEKVSKLEPSVVRCTTEIAKAKEKRREGELKKKAMLEDKAKKGADLLEKKREKEAVAAAKKAEVEKEKLAKKTELEKEKVAKAAEKQAEKDAKDAEKNAKEVEKNAVEAAKKAKLDKQKNLMFNMFGGSGKKTAATAATPGSSDKAKAQSSSTPSKSASGSAVTVDLTGGSSESTDTNTKEVAVVVDAAVAAQKEAAALALAEQHRLEAEIKVQQEEEANERTDSLLALWTSGSSSAGSLNGRTPVDLSDSFCSEAISRRAHITISVMATSLAPAVFGEASYAEMKDVRIDPSMRSFTHCDEHRRPDYWGTKSKTSGVISGRRPFAKDFSVVNYDFDSDDEWESDAEGEDIADSDDEEDADGNELEYDDFFRHDNDFGSDADSDGEMVAAVQMKKTHLEETVGLRFLHTVANEGGMGWHGEHVLPAGSAGSFRFPINDEGEADAEADAEADKSEAEARSGTHKRKKLVCTEQEKDTARLRMYGSVVFSTPQHIPFLGWTETRAGRKPSKQNNGNSSSKDKDAAGGEDSGAQKESKEKKEKKVKEPKVVVPKEMTPSLLPDLVKFVYGKKDGLEKLVTGFHERHPLEIKANINRRIRQIAEKQKHTDGHGQARWVVKADIVEQLALTVGTSSVPVVDVAVAVAAESSTSEATDAPKVEGEKKESGVASPLKSTPASVTSEFDLEAISYTPPRVKKTKRIKPETVGSPAPAAKSSRLRGDTDGLMKGIRNAPKAWGDWTGDPEARKKMEDEGKAELEAQIREARRQEKGSAAESEDDGEEKEFDVAVDMPAAVEEDKAEDVKNEDVTEMQQSALAVEAAIIEVPATESAESASTDMEVIEVEK